MTLQVVGSETSLTNTLLMSSKLESLSLLRQYFTYVYNKCPLNADLGSYCRAAKAATGGEAKKQASKGGVANAMVAAGGGILWARLVGFLNNIPAVS